MILRQSACALTRKRALVKRGKREPLCQPSYTTASSRATTKAQSTSSPRKPWLAVQLQQHAAQDVRQGKLDEAVIKLNKAVALETSSTSAALLSLARVQLKADDLQSARASVEKALSLSGGDQSLSLAAGDILSQIGDVASARALLQPLVENGINRNRVVPTLISVRARAILVRSEVAAVAENSGVSDSVINELQDVCSWLLKILGGKHSETLAMYTELARAHFRRSEFQSARTLVEFIGSVKERLYSNSAAEVHDVYLGPLEALHRSIVANMPNVSPKPFPKAPYASKSRIVDPSIRTPRIVKSEPKWHQEKVKKRRKIELELIQKSK